MHSPNPNQVTYPFAFEGVRWDVDIPAELLSVVQPPHQVGIGRDYGDANDIYYIRRRLSITHIFRDFRLEIRFDPVFSRTEFVTQA